MGLRDLILGATEPPFEVVYVPALKESVVMVGMTGGERDAFEASCFEGRGRKREFTTRDLRAKLVAYCTYEPKHVIGDNGERRIVPGAKVFTDADVPALSGVRADLTDRLFGPAQRLSGMSDQDVDELGQASANLTASDSSSSVSRAN